MKKYSVLVVEDYKFVLDTIADFIDKDGNFSVVGKLTDADDILPFLASRGKAGKQVDLVLSDVCTDNNHNALSYVKEIKAAYPNVKVILMSGLTDAYFIKKATECGVDSFLYKNTDAPQFLTIMKSTMEGYVTFPNPKQSFMSALNPTEEEIVRLATEGFDRKEIAAKLGIAETSLRVYISNLLSKTDFKSLTQLTIFVVKNGIVVPRGK